MQKLKQLYERYEGRLSVLAVVLGFTIDSLTLDRIDQGVEQAILGIYLGILAIITLTLAWLTRSEAWEAKLGWWLRLIMQFALGGLFSGYLVVYLRSASIFAAWPFILILLAILIGNEVMRERYRRLPVRMTLLFTAIFTFSIFYIPILIGKVGAWPFLFSGLVSLIVIVILAYIAALVSRFTPRALFGRIAPGVLGVFVAFNFLYFTNIIPPIPLSLKESAVFHSVSKSGSGYNVKYEKYPWWAWYKRDEVHLTAGSKIFLFTAIFAPAEIDSNIVHHWQYKGDHNKEWLEVSKIPFGITGGRDGGYRGYTWHSAPQEGKWRVDIRTERGALLGRETFQVHRVTASPELATEAR